MFTVSGTFFGVVIILLFLVSILIAFLVGKRDPRDDIKEPGCCGKSCDNHCDRKTTGLD